MSKLNARFQRVIFTPICSNRFRGSASWCVLRTSPVNRKGGSRLLALAVWLPCKCCSLCSSFTPEARTTGLSMRNAVLLYRQLIRHMIDNAWRESLASNVTRDLNPEPAERAVFSAVWSDVISDFLWSVFLFCLIIWCTYAFRETKKLHRLPSYCEWCGVLAGRWQHCCLAALKMAA